MSTGNLVTVSDNAASSISNGRPRKRSSNLDSHLSKAVGVMCEALGPSTSSSVLLHHTEIEENMRNNRERKYMFLNVNFFFFRERNVCFK